MKSWVVTSCIFKSGKLMSCSPNACKKRLKMLPWASPHWSPGWGYSQPMVNTKSALPPEAWIVDNSSIVVRVMQNHFLDRNSNSQVDILFSWWAEWRFARFQSDSGIETIRSRNWMCWVRRPAHAKSRLQITVWFDTIRSNVFRPRSLEFTSLHRICSSGGEIL